MSMTMSRLLLTAGVSIATGVLVTPVHAQELALCQFRGAPEALSERPSPLDSVIVRLGDAEAKLCYGRPSARGRTIVGGLDPFGQPWRMGANEPTTLHLPFPARVGGVDLEAGSYSLYAITGEAEWTVVMNSNTNRWGIPISPDVRSSDVGSVVVRPRDTGEHVETLTFSFSGSGSSGTLTFAWERASFDLQIARR
jgi:hypothetical protein